MSDDEVSPVRSLTRLRPEPVLPGGEGTDPPAEFHPGPPGHRRQVQPHEPGPFDHEQAAEDDKEDKGDVKADGQIREDAIQHGATCLAGDSVGKAQWPREGESL